MSASVALEVHIIHDRFNPPELRNVATTLVVKVPPRCSLPIFNQKIAGQYSVMASSSSTYYFFNNTGHQIYMHGPLQLEHFWQYQEGIAEGLCELYVEALFCKHPTKKCSICYEAIYGSFNSCDCGGFQSCLNCRDYEENKCPSHGEELIRIEYPPVHPAVFAIKYYIIYSSIRTYYNFIMRERASHNND